MSRPKPDKEDVPVRVNVSMPYHMWAQCLRKHWKWSEVFRAGYGVISNNGTIGERLYALEQEVAAARTKIAALQQSAKKRPLMAREPVKFDD